MSRNDGTHFSLAPQVDIQRSRFHRNSNLKTSFNVGDLVPIYVDEVLPGDTFSVKTSKVLRLQTLITPVMDNLNVDVYYFFVPNRLIWNHWKEFMGENTTSAWIPSVEYSIPKVTAPSGGWNVGTIADYMGIPTGVDGFSVNALPFRAYAKCVDDWFRDENNQQPIYMYDGDNTITGKNTDTYFNAPIYGAQPFKAAKYHDYFTSCLPAPQKGPNVLLPLGNSAPVYTGSDDHLEVGDDAETMHWKYRTSSDSKLFDFGASDQRWVSVYGSNGNLRTINGSGSLNNEYMVPVNLYADLSSATASTISELRMAFQIQRLYERDARAGTRYIESVRAHFGVTSPDARLQRSEYLGGNRFPLNVQQVSQTSSTDSVTPQGNLAGFSVTADTNHDFTKSFTEHGYIIGLAVARYSHSYQQGLERHWSRDTRFDYYYPVLANISEQAVKKKEIYLQGTHADLGVFGYQEAWADYRYKPDRITGQMRSAANGALDSWHFADNYASLPTLSADWIMEDSSNVDRALAVTSSTAHQIFGDFYFECSVTRPMPLYSVPGMIDHL